MARGWWLLVLGVGALACGCSKAERSAPAPAATAPGANAPKAGEPVATGDSTWVLVAAKELGNKLEPNTPYGETKQTAGRFVLVRYKVTNTGKKPESVLDPPRLIDDKGREHTRLDLESVYVPGKTATLGIELLPPGVEREYATIVDVPADAHGLRLQFRGLGLLGQKRQLDLGL